MSVNKVVLTIGGFDPCCGAGVCADIKTFGVHKVYALSVTTAIVVQNTTGVFEIEPISPKAIKEQLIRVKEDFNINGIKISVVYNKKIAQVISECLDQLSQVIIFDPIIKSKNGFILMKEEDIDEIKNILFPLATIITPNIDEAEFFSGIKINDVEDMKRVAKTISDLGPKSVLIKGGHLKGEFKQDVFFDGKDFFVFKERAEVDFPVHGTGCAFSSAILANIVKGEDVVTSIKKAKKYISHLISNSLVLGKGYRLLNHFYGEGTC